MSLSKLTAISPIDGRYHDKTLDLSPIFSEYGLIFYRICVEIKWFQSLAKQDFIKEVPTLSKDANLFLENIIENFSIEQAQSIKDYEKITNHDVKACEYFLKDQFDKLPELSKLKEFIHFACTSEDINNLAYALMLKKARNDVILPQLTQILSSIKLNAEKYAIIPMLSRTHGQSATPTTLGKEFSNFAYRLNIQVKSLSAIDLKGKINGAVGNFNAHISAYPEVDWPKHSEDFVTSLDLCWNPYTTQIEPHDFIAEFSHNLSRINAILIDYTRDIWSYISIGYFKQKSAENEVGSSTMPHKVNPIDFENSEGNLELSNTLLTHFAKELTNSRWQRDLTDSTLMRNLGVTFGYSIIAYKSILKGNDKLEANLDILNDDLDKHWEVLTEAIQTVMRRYGIENPYEKLKDFSRGKTLNQDLIHQFINELELPKDIKQNLLKLTPATYTGLAADMSKKIAK